MPNDVDATRSRQTRIKWIWGNGCLPGAVALIVAFPLNKPYLAVTLMGGYATFIVSGVLILKMLNRFRSNPENVKLAVVTGTALGLIASITIRSLLE